MNGNLNGRISKPSEIERDEHLVEINAITKNLKENVHAINSSIDSQSGLIKKISTNVEKNHKKMNFVMDKLSLVLQTKGILIR